MSAFAKSLVTTISPSIIECDAQLDNVISAQNILLSKLDTVSKELDQLSTSNKSNNNSEAPLPDLEPHTNKIIAIKKRVSGTIKKITSIKQRLEYIERGLNKRKNSLKIHETNLNNALSGNTTNTNTEAITTTTTNNNNNNNNNTEEKTTEEEQQQQDKSNNKKEEEIDNNNTTTESETTAVIKEGEATTSTE